MVKINLEGKYLYVVFILLVIGFGVVVVNATYDSGYYHHLRDVVDNDNNPIDANDNGIVDSVDDANLLNGMTSQQIIDASASAGVALYRVASICVGTGSLTTASTCTPRECMWCGSICWTRRFDCDGTCEGVAGGNTPCANTLIGHLIE